MAGFNGEYIKTTELGTLSDGRIVELGHYKDGDKEYLVPAIADVVNETDIENKIMKITPLKGLFEDED